MQRAGCVPAHAVSAKPMTAGVALSMTQRTAGRNGNDRSGRLRGVSPLTANPTGTLLRRSPPQRTPGFSPLPSIGSGGRGGHFPQEMFVLSGFMATFAQTKDLKSTLFILYFYMKAPRCETGCFFMATGQREPSEAGFPLPNRLFLQIMFSREHECERSEDCPWPPDNIRRLVDAH